MSFFPVVGTVSNSSILVDYLSICFCFLGSGRNAATGKVLSGFYYLFLYCSNLVRALVMLGWNNCLLYLISCNLVLKCFSLSTSFMLAVVILLMILCGSYFKIPKIQMSFSF